MLLIIGASVGMAWLCNYSNGGVDLYMTTFMTLMYVLVVLVLFARCVDGARGVYLPCCVMILCGIARLRPSKTGIQHIPDTAGNFVDISDAPVRVKIRHLLQQCKKLRIG